MLPLARRPMGVLTAVVEIATLAMLHPGQDVPFGRAVALQLIRNDHARDIPQALEQLAKELLGRVLVAAALHQNVEDVILLVDSAPQVMALPVDRQKDLVQVPFVAWLGASTLQPIRVVLPKLQTPLANGFMGDVDTAFAQQFLHVAVAQGEAGIEPDAMADDLAWKAVIFVACGLSGWRHVGFLSGGRLGLWGASWGALCHRRGRIDTK